MKTIPRIHYSTAFFRLANRRVEMKKCSLALLLLIILFWPSISSAHNFTGSNGLFFNANSGVYRQKSDSRPWQLVSLPNQSKVIQSVSFDGKIWLVVEIASQQYLFRQDSSLKFITEDRVEPAIEIFLKVTASHLVILQRDNRGVKLSLFQIDDQYSQIVPPLITDKRDLDRLFELNHQLIYISQSNENVSIYQNSHNWQLINQIICAQSRLIIAPITGLFCQDGSVIRIDSVEKTTKLNLAPLNGLFSSSELIAGWDKNDQHLFHVWREGVTTDILLPTLPAPEVTKLVVSGQRILFKKLDGNWFELIWRIETPKLVELIDTISGEIVPIVNSRGLMINGTTPQLSSGAGQWQIITTVGAFNTAQQTPLGLLIWNNGSLTQFAPSGSTVYKKVNPWSSTTSPIQAVEIGPVTSYISVITNSGRGNVNLYKTTDFIKWTRVTLPTKPTLSPTIFEARSLVAGSLVELIGVITVGPKIVDSEVIYLEDASGGIQIYLNQSGGTLPTQTNRFAVASGEISSSQTKRVIISSALELELGSTTTWTRPVIGADEADSYLGRSVQIKGVVETTNTDYLNFHRIAGSLKLHLESAKTILRPDDQLIVPSVVDWNSASGQSEAWALSNEYLLLSRAEVVTAPTANNQAVSTPAVATPKSAPAKKSPTKKSVATNTTPPPIAVRPPTLPPAPVIIGAIESTQAASGTSETQTISLGLVSLVTGLLSFRGRRFRQFLSN